MGLYTQLIRCNIKTSRGGLVCKGVNQIQVDWTLQAVVQIPLRAFKAHNM